MKKLLKQKKTYSKSVKIYFISFLLALEYKAADKTLITELPQAASSCRQGNLLPAGAVYIFKIVSAFSVYRSTNYLHVVCSCHFQLFFGPDCFAPIHNNSQCSLQKLGHQAASPKTTPRNLPSPGS